MRSFRSKSVTEWPALVELRGGGEARRPGADDGDAAAGAKRRRLRRDPALGECAVDDRLLDLLDRDGVVVDVEHAGRLAWRRADAPGELGEVVGRVQARRSRRASGRGRRGRSSPGSGCRAGSLSGRRESPQSMQRAPCSRSCGTASGSWYSRSRARARRPGRFGRVDAVDLQKAARAHPRLGSTSSSAPAAASAWRRLVGPGLARLLAPRVPRRTSASSCLARLADLARLLVAFGGRYVGGRRAGAHRAATVDCCRARRSQPARRPRRRRCSASSRSARL